MSKRKYNICITLNGEPFLPYNKPLSKRNLPTINGKIFFYTRATIFDAETGEILGIGHSTQRVYRDRMHFLDSKPWRAALRQAIPKARARVKMNNLIAMYGHQPTVCRRKKQYTFPIQGGNS